MAAHQVQCTFGTLFAWQLNWILQVAGLIRSGLIPNPFLSHSSSPFFSLNFDLGVTSNTANFRVGCFSTWVPCTMAPPVAVGVFYNAHSSARHRPTAIESTRNLNFKKHPHVILANTPFFKCLVKWQRKRTLVLMTLRGATIANLFISQMTLGNSRIL